MNSFAATEVFVPRGTKLPFDEHGVQVLHAFAGEGVATIFQLPAGKMIRQHRHKIPHHATLLLGHAVVEVQGFRRSMISPQTMRIAENETHEITAVTDCVWVCIWPHGDPEGQIAK